jgi:hypothetical protein
MDKNLKNIDLSIVLCARNDNHLGNFKNRLKFSLERNISILEKYEINYEYVMVDYLSEDKKLYETEMFSDLFKNEKIKNIIVNKEVIKKFRNDIFYQFYAKNIGIRRCSGKYILIMNCDNFFDEQTISEIKNVLISNENNFYFRPEYWVEYDINRNVYFGKLPSFCAKETDKDHFLGPCYAGDFLLINKETLLKYGGGYDETNLNHYTDKNQNSMDGELLFNLYYNDIKPKVLNCNIYHVYHPRSNNLENTYNTNGYKNTDDWGLSNLEMKEIRNNVFKLL